MNIVLTLLGWGLWNLIEWNLEKNKADDQDKDFDGAAYRKKKKDDWIVSFFVAVFLLVVGHMGLGLDLLRVVDSEHPAKWSDLYYAGSGFLYEVLKFLIKKFKGSKQ